MVVFVCSAYRDYGDFGGDQFEELRRRGGVAAVVADFQDVCFEVFRDAEGHVALGLDLGVAFQEDAWLP